MKKRFLLLLLIPVIIFSGCEEINDPVEPGNEISEAETVVNYLESNGDFINSGAPALISAEEVKNSLATPKAEYLIDLRSSVDFITGHIEGAKNVLFRDLITHVKAVKDSGYSKFVLICYSGQIAAYGTALLRFLGYYNTYALNYGMSSWNQVFANDYWAAKTANNHSSEFVTTNFPKNASGNFPVLSTGKKTAKEIIEVRAAQLASEGFGGASLSNDAVFSNLPAYYIVNYWNAGQYSAMGHMPNAVQYTPQNDLKKTAYLKTLPVNKTIAIYCYTGQTSAFVAAYLKLLGYDVRSIMYGANNMIYDKMVAAGSGYIVFTQNDIKNFPYTSGK